MHLSSYKIPEATKMSKKKSLKNTAIFAVPLAILIGTASYIGYSVHKQAKVLNDVAFMVQNSRPLVTDREQLRELFSKYISAGGLDLTRSPGPARHAPGCNGRPGPPRSPSP